MPNTRTPVPFQTLEHMIVYYDRSILSQLDVWILEQIQGDTRRSLVRDAMIRLLATDIEYWSGQAYWNWIDSGLMIDARDLAYGRTEPDEYLRRLGDRSPLSSFQTMTPTDHEKREWSRLAQDAYWKGFNDIGHRFSVAAALRNGESMPITRFDSLQVQYRRWLIAGF